ncbi:putative retroelement [Phytophthora cinnamomi]|uniref:putative retroelement n=1 Tax=Phytophthora cinnamomi TaxID=4785 RepID=UPI00355A422D|nr:putative retroelement [Phytophthora cinnamomi]
MEHQAAGMQLNQFMQTIEHITAGLSQQNAQIYQDFQAYLQGYQQQVQQQLQAHSAQCEHKIEGVTIPTYHGRMNPWMSSFSGRSSSCKGSASTSRTCTSGLTSWLCSLPTFETVQRHGIMRKSWLSM